MYLCRDEIRDYCSWRRFKAGSRRYHRTQTVGEGEGRTAHRQTDKGFFMENNATEISVICNEQMDGVKSHLKTIQDKD